MKFLAMNIQLATKCRLYIMNYYFLVQLLKVLFELIVIRLSGGKR